MAVDLPVMDGGGGSAIANGLHVLIPCKSIFQWHMGVFHGRSTLAKRVKIKMKERKRSLRLMTQESWTCQMFRSSDAEGSNRGM